MLAGRGGRSGARVAGIRGCSYQGLPGSAITPIKKPPGEKLHDHHRATNHDINSLRAAVELANAHIKNRKILHPDYRRPLKTFNKRLMPSAA